MNRVSLAVAALALATGLPALAQGGPGGAAMTEKTAAVLPLDPAASKISWTAKKVTFTHHGGFKSFSGSVALVEGDADASRVTVEIDTPSIFADNERLTGHLKSKDFFEVEAFPKATFRSQKVRPATADVKGATHVVVGTLEIKGVKKTVTFPARITVDATGVSASATFTINRKEWNILYAGKPDDLIADDVEVSFEIKAPRKKA